MTIIYDILFAVFALFYLPYLFARRKWHKDFAIRFGRFPDDLKRRLAAKDNIWFHAVSVGEVMVVVGLLERMREDLSSMQIVLSTVTRTGNELARSRLGDRAVVIYAPLDFSWIVRRFIRCIRPRLYVAVETELWPNLFLSLAAGKIPIVVVNGRISDGSFMRYKSIPFFSRKIIGAVNAFCMQSSRDADKIGKLGAVQQNIHIPGNMKFDCAPVTKVYEFEDLGFTGAEQIWIAGSTHPGEEEIILETYCRISKEFADLRLILAPRHVERAPEVSGLVRRFGLAPVLFSKRERVPLDCGQIIVVDTIGDLKPLYSLARIVFMGKSLCGRGGQNILEPALYAKPVIVGPNMQNFRLITRLLLDVNGLIQIESKNELRQAVANLLQNPGQAMEIGRNALNLLSKHRGATEQTRRVILCFLPQVPA